VGGTAPFEGKGVDSYSKGGACLGKEGDRYRSRIVKNLAQGGHNFFSKRARKGILERLAGEVIWMTHLRE